VVTRVSLDAARTEAYTDIFKNCLRPPPLPPRSVQFKLTCCFFFFFLRSELLSRLHENPSSHSERMERSSAELHPPHRETKDDEDDGRRGSFSHHLVSNVSFATRVTRVPQAVPV